MTTPEQIAKRLTYLFLSYMRENYESVFKQVREYEEEYPDPDQDQDEMIYSAMGEVVSGCNEFILYVRTKTGETLEQVEGNIEDWWLYDDCGDISVELYKELEDECRPCLK